MKYRRIGATQLELSEIGFGCGGNAGLMVRGDIKEQTRMVARAIELGFNYFDNSPDYGDGKAEENLGLVLRELKHRPVLNSKIEIRAENLGNIADHVVRSVEHSLKRLKIDYLDVVQIHNGPVSVPPKLEGKVYTHLWNEDYLAPGGAIDGLLRLKRDGKLRYSGFICRGNDAQEVCDLLDTTYFSLINVPYTLFNPSAGRAMPDGLKAPLDFGNVISQAVARGAGSAIYAPLAGGALSDDAISGAPRHPLARQENADGDKARKERTRATSLAFLARDNGINMAQAAFRFILDHPAVTVALGGFSSMQQLEEIAAVPDLPSFSAMQMARLDTAWHNNLGV